MTRDIERDLERNADALRDDELDTAVGGVVLRRAFVTGYQLSLYGDLPSPILLPPNPC
jgi:hypothetical protein